MGASPGPKLFHPEIARPKFPIAFCTFRVTFSPCPPTDPRRNARALPAGRSTLTCTLCFASNTSRGVTLYETCFCQGTPASTHQTLCHAGFSGNGADSSGSWLCHLKPPHPDAHVPRSAHRVRLGGQHDHG